MDLSAYAEIDRLKEVLRFYSDKWNYEVTAKNEDLSEAEKDGGARARSVL